MKVYILSFRNDVLGIFSSKESADEAEVFYSDLPYFNNKDEDFWQEEFELDKFSDEDYLPKDETNDNNKNNKIKDYIIIGMWLSLAFIIIIIILLGINSFFEMLFNLFKH